MQSTWPATKITFIPELSRGLNKKMTQLFHHVSEITSFPHTPLPIPPRNTEGQTVSQTYYIFLPSPALCSCCSLCLRHFLLCFGHSPLIYQHSVSTLLTLFLLRPSPPIRQDRDPHALLPQHPLHTIGCAMCLLLYHLPLLCELLGEHDHILSTQETLS